MATTTTKRATKLKAATFYAACPCGGDVLSVGTGSYQLYNDRSDLVCDTCDAAIEITGKTAKL